MVKIYLFRLKIKNGDKMYEEIKDKAFEHKHALIFVGGIAAAVVGKKILESKTVKEATTNAVAGVMAVKQDAEDRLDEIKADAEAQLEDEDKVEIEIEAEDVEEEEEEKPKASKKSKKSKK